MYNTARDGGRAFGGCWGYRAPSNTRGLPWIGARPPRSPLSAGAAYTHHHFCTQKPRSQRSHAVTHTAPRQSSRPPRRCAALAPPNYLRLWACMVALSAGHLPIGARYYVCAPIGGFLVFNRLHLYFSKIGELMPRCPATYCVK